MERLLIGLWPRSYGVTVAESAPEPLGRGRDGIHKDDLAGHS